MAPLARFRAPRNLTLGIALVAISAALGLGVAIGTSMSSITIGTSRTAETARSEPTPTPVPTPTPRPVPSGPGMLGSAPLVQVAGDGTLVARAGARLYLSHDGAGTWQQVGPPPGATSLVPDLGNLNIALAAGQSILLSQDAGGSWKAPRTAPPPGGTYQALMVNPGDPSVWLLNHEGRLLRTRDGGVSWKELSGISLSSPVVVAGPGKDQFFVASGSGVQQLENNGEQIIDRGLLPGGLKAVGLGVAGGNGGVLIALASDGKLYVGKGTSWTASSARFGGPLASLPDKVVVAADGGGRLGVAAQLLVSTDQGVSWKDASGLPADQSGEAVAFTADGAKGYLVGFGGDVFTSSDLGATWTFLNSSLRSPGS